MTYIPILPSAPRTAPGVSTSQFTELSSKVATLQVAQPPPPSGNLIKVAPTVAHTNNLTITVGAAEYQIQGTDYVSQQKQLTAATADPTNPRIDLVVLTTTADGSFSGSPALITGTPASSPATPQYDPLTQIYLGFIQVAAGATVAQVNVEPIYRENAEWTTSQTGGHLNFDDTSDPVAGTKAIKGTNVAAGDTWLFTRSSSMNLEDYENIVLFVLPTNWASAKSWTVRARLAGVAKGQAVVVKNGNFGLNTASTTIKQQLVIPTAAFGLAGQAVDQLHFTVSGGGAVMNFILDEISLQGGVRQQTDSTRMRPRGAWSATKQYDPNDGVVANRIQWIAKRPNYGKTPYDNPLDWEAQGEPLRHFKISFNPKAVCDLTNDRLFLMRVGPDAPSGIKIVQWNLSFDAAPVTQADLDFKRADAFIGVANPAVMDVLDTTAGVSSETTPANINGGATVANGKVLYLEFGTGYTTDGLQMIFEFWYYAA